MGFSIRGFIWDIPILIFAYVPFGVLGKGLLERGGGLKFATCRSMKRCHGLAFGGVVKIMVPFWVPRVPKRDHNLTTTHLVDGIVTSWLHSCSLNSLGRGVCRLFRDLNQSSLNLASVSLETSSPKLGSLGSRNRANHRQHVMQPRPPS